MSYFNPEEIWLINNRALAEEYRTTWLGATPQGLLLRPGLFSFNQFIQRLLWELPPGRGLINPWARKFWLMAWVTRNWPLGLEDARPSIISHLAETLGQLWSAWTASGLSASRLAGLSPADWAERLAEGFQEYQDYQASLGQDDQAGRIRTLLAALAEGVRPPVLQAVSRINVGPVFGLSALEIDLIKVLRRLAEVKVRFKIPAWALAGRPRAAESGLNASLALNALEASAASQTAMDRDLDLIIEPLADREAPETLRWAAENLLAFSYDERDFERPDFKEQLVFYEAPEAKDEARAAGRRLRMLLDQGFPPEELALVAPDLDLYEPLAAAAAEQYGLPLAARGPRLGKTGPARAFWNWLDLLNSSWPRLKLAQLLASPYFGFTSLPAETIYELTLKAGLTDQRAGVSFPDLLLRLPQTPARELAAVGRKLLQYDYSLRQARDWPAFFQLLDDFLAWSGFKDHLGPEPLDQAAGARLGALLTEAGQILSQPEAPAVNLELFKLVLTELIGGQRLNFNLGPAGRIRLLTYEEAAGRRFSEVFLLGLGEKVFPSPAEAALPWPESLERGLSASLGRLRWPGPAENYRRQEEWLGRIIGRTAKRVNLFYSRLNQELRPVLPSPLWGGLRRLAADPPPVISVPVNPERRPENIHSLEEMWLKGLTEAAFSPDTLSGFQPEDRQFGRALRRRELARRRRRAWLANLILAGSETGEIPGRPLISPAGLKDWLGRLKRWRGQPSLSPSQLESYARCPFFFWLDELIKSRPEQEPTDDPQASELGSVAHAALNEFVASQVKKGRWPLTDDPPTQNLLEKAVEKHCRQHEQSHSSGRAPIWAARRDYLKKIMSQWLRREAASPAAQNFTPALFEWPFGQSSPEGRLNLFTAEEKPSGAEAGWPVPIVEGPPGWGLALSGRIDRIDLGSQEALVWDYKLNFREDLPKRLCPGPNRGPYFQLAVYTLAASRHLGRVTRAGYKYLAGPETEESFGPASVEPVLSLDPALRRSMAAKGQFNLPNLIERLWEKLRGGYFPPQSGDHCSFCPAAHLCPVKEA